MRNQSVRQNGGVLVRAIGSATVVASVTGAAVGTPFLPIIGTAFGAAYGLSIGAAVGLAWSLALAAGVGIGLPRARVVVLGALGAAGGLYGLIVVATSPSSVPPALLAVLLGYVAGWSVLCAPYALDGRAPAEDRNGRRCRLIGSVIGAAIGGPIALGCVVSGAPCLVTLVAGGVLVALGAVFGSVGSQVRGWRQAWRRWR